MQKPKISFKTIMANSTLDSFKADAEEDIKFVNKQKKVDDFQ